jgi:signal transduction histidine kinase
LVAASRSLWRELLFPDEERREPPFRAYIERLSVIGLRVIGVICIGGVAYVAFASWLLPRGLPSGFDWRLPAAISTLGLFALAVSFWPRARPHCRAAGMLVGYGVAVSQFFSMASLVENEAVAAYLVSGIVTGVMFVGLATLPLRPLHVLGLGSTIALTYRLLLPRSIPQLTANRTGLGLLFVTQTVLLATALAMVVYRQRVLGYRARRSARRALEELREAQASLLVAESAHAQSRFAAAMSHELNTPLGALTSAFETLLVAHRRRASFPAERLERALSEAEASGRASVARIRETLERMKFLSNLDRAEEQTLDLNVLCREVAASLSSDIEPSAELQLRLEPLPPLRCRPQQIGAVLSNLLRNAAAAMEQRGHIVLSTARREDRVVLQVRDDGRGIPEERLGHLFEPSLAVTGSRVATRNWGLFVSRAIVTEHGGELEIASELGKGTTARVLLPLPAGG